MKQRNIRVQRIVGLAEETEFNTDLNWSNKELVEYFEQNHHNFHWTETEVITHFNIVENYA